MRDHLTKLGMTLAFNRTQADFSAIKGHKQPYQETLFNSDVFHKALVEVNEEGTETAAATAASMEVCALSIIAVPGTTLALNAGTIVV